MAFRNEQLQKVQLGTESTWGSAVAQDTMIAGKPVLKPAPDVQIESWAEMGYLTNTDAYISGIDGSANLESIPCYEQIHIWLESLLGAVTASGAGPYTRVYDLPLTANPTDHAFYTIASGDSGGAYALVGALLKKLTIEAMTRDKSKLSAEFLGRRVEADTIDTVSKPTATYIRSSDAAISECAIGGTHAAITCAPKGIKLEIDSGLVLYDGMGSLEKCAYDYVGEQTATLSVTARADNSAIQSLAEWALGSAPAVTEREIRILFTSGAQSVQIDFIGRLDSSPDLREFDNGAGIFTLPLTAQSNPSANLTTTAARITVINNTA